MNKFFKELRRREVFRTGGLYVGVAWIIIEVASVILPTFDIAEWVFKALVITAFAGFPVALVLAWFYDITERGVVLDDEEHGPPATLLGGRQMDFIVIGVLAIALIFSIYINLSRAPEVPIELEPVSVLIADFENRTNDPVFDGALEQALNLGIEGASFITSYRRDRALSQAQELKLGQKLDEEAARLVAVRQDVKMVLAGSIVPDGDGYALMLRAVDPTSGEVSIDVKTSVDSRADVLGAVNTLAADMRKELGDESLDVDQLASGETVTATSLEALKYYVLAQDLARAGKDEEAISHYEQAVEIDPDFARAYSGWALSAFKIGRRTEAEEQWKKALSLLDRMTERERYRTLGLYYTRVSLNYDKAIENFEQLVEKFPADGAGHNNLSVLYFLSLQFEKAVAESGRLIKIYPTRTLYRSNHALNAMWAGDLETAVVAAESVIAEDPTAFKPFLVLAMAALDAGDIESARAAYQRMESTGARGKSLANMGMADLALFAGDAKKAESILVAGIEQDRSDDNERGVGAKTIALAEAYLAQERNAEALDALRGLSTDRLGDGQLLPAAAMFTRLGDFESAQAIADQLGNQLRPQSRAYARLITGMIALKDERYIPAIDELKAALGFADLWIVRFYLGQAYLAASYPAESTAEFDAAYQRRGEAMAMFFDDLPTWRYMASLAEWTEKAQDALTKMGST
jgi:tetratricopeptide (TPR) repeat protein